MLSNTRKMPRSVAIYLFPDAIDTSLHLIERLAGRELALLTARQMDFD